MYKANCMRRHGSVTPSITYVTDASAGNAFSVFQVTCAICDVNPGSVINRICLSAVHWRHVDVISLSRASSEPRSRRDINNLRPATESSRDTVWTCCRLQEEEEITTADSSACAQGKRKCYCRITSAAAAAAAAHVQLCGWDTCRPQLSLISLTVSDWSHGSDGEFLQSDQTVQTGTESLSASKKDLRQKQHVGIHGACSGCYTSRGVSLTDCAALLETDMFCLQSYSHCLQYWYKEKSGEAETRKRRVSTIQWCGLETTALVSRSVTRPTYAVFVLVSKGRSLSLDLRKCSTFHKL